jgi:hypothetical protein
MSDYTVIPKPGSNRFVIADTNGKIVEDANGYGYLSKNSAEKAKWYKFGGGEKKIKATKDEAKKFWASHKDVAKDLRDLFDMWVKEICFGEITEDELIEEVCKKYYIDKISKKYLEYLPN